MRELHAREGQSMVEKKVQQRFLYFDNVNSESYQTFLAYCERPEYEYDVELRKSIDVKRSMKPRVVRGNPGKITDEMQ
jgi:hypothetical protein